MVGPMGNSVRLFIGVTVAVLVVVNLVVLMWVGPEVATTDDIEKVQPTKDWEQQDPGPEEPDVYTIEESEPPDDEK